MDVKKNVATKITVGDLELWTAPFGAKKATITAIEGGAKRVLLNLHKKLPDVFELLVDDEDFCEEDMDGAFSVIVDPEQVSMAIYPGEGKFGFNVSRPCDGDCENCKLEGCDHAAEEDPEMEDVKGGAQ